MRAHSLKPPKINPVYTEPREYILSRMSLLFRIGHSLKFVEVDRQTFDIPLSDKNNIDLHYTVKSNSVGGLSIVYQRYHGKDVIRIREKSTAPNLGSVNMGECYCSLFAYR